MCALHQQVVVDADGGQEFGQIVSDCRRSSGERDRADRKSKVRQCLGFSTANFWSSLAYESAEQKPCKNPNIALLETSHQLWPESNAPNEPAELRAELLPLCHSISVQVAQSDRLGGPRFSAIIGYE